eukprot:GHVS01098464.1.p1 GENE.GHVS01098464.1~~GHVS01098464.1.p1  ORF type:complete len:487 (+),score=167.31 GHVS01098464.1:163-1623(+)
MKFCLFASVVTIFVVSAVVIHAQDENSDQDVVVLLPEEAASEAANAGGGGFLAPTPATTTEESVPWIETADDVAEEAEVANVTGDMEGRVIDVVELAPDVEEQEEVVMAAVPPTQEEEEEAFSWTDDVEVDDQEPLADVLSVVDAEAIPMVDAEEEEVVVVDDIDAAATPADAAVPFVFAEEEPTTVEVMGPEVLAADQAVMVVDQDVPSFVEEGEEEEVEVVAEVASLLESAVRPGEGDTSSAAGGAAGGAGGGGATADPRQGICTESELDNVKQFFTTNEDTCEAYQCVADYNMKFFESLLVHYNGLWTQGGDAKVNSVASLLSACTCRCAMMKCEVDFMKYNSSPKCFSSTIDYCDKQNDLFVERCEKAATQYLDAINEVAPEANWGTACLGACSRGDEPVAGLTLDPVDGPLAAGQEGGDEMHESFEEVPAAQDQPGVDVTEQLMDDVEELMEDAGVAAGADMKWAVAVGCALMAAFGGSAW